MEILYGLQPRISLQDVVDALESRPGEWIALRDSPLTARNQDGLLFLRLCTEAPQPAPTTLAFAPTVTPPTSPKVAPAPRTLRVPKTDRMERIRAKHVARAQELAASNGGVLVLGQDHLTNRSLYTYIALHPEAFAHIQMRKGRHLDSPESRARLKANSEKIVEQSRAKRVQQAQELAAENGGLLPPLQALRKIDEGLYRFVLNHPSWFAHVPQAQPLSRRKVKVAREVVPTPDRTVQPVPVVVPEPVVVAVPEPIVGPLLVVEPVPEPIPAPAPRPTIPLPKPHPYLGGTVVPLPHTTIPATFKEVGLMIDKLLSELEHLAEPGEEVVLELGPDATHHQGFTREVYEEARTRKLTIGTRQKGSKLFISLVQVRTR